MFSTTGAGCKPWVIVDIDVERDYVCVCVFFFYFGGGCISSDMVTHLPLHDDSCAPHVKTKLMCC